MVILSLAFHSNDLMSIQQDFWQPIDSSANVFHNRIFPFFSQSNGWTTVWTRRRRRMADGINKRYEFMIYKKAQTYLLKMRLNGVYGLTDKSYKIWFMIMIMYVTHIDYGQRYALFLFLLSLSLSFFALVPKCNRYKWCLVLYCENMFGVRVCKQIQEGWIDWFDKGECHSKMPILKRKFVMRLIASS